LIVSKQAPSFTVTTASEKVTLDKSGAARVPFVVTNTSAQALQGQLYAQPLGGAKPEWFTVVGESIRDFAPGEVQQVVVELKVPPVPPGTPTASYSFRLDAVSGENPDEDFTEGQSVAFDVKAPPPPEKKKFPWLWILIAVGAVVLLIIIGVVVWLLVRDTSVTVPRVVGETRATAENRLTDAGFTVKVTFEPVGEEEQHDVVQSQVPEGGTKQKEKTEVTISVGRMPTVPGLKGLTQAQAIGKLEEVGLGVDVRNVGVQDPRQDGIVQSQDPAEGTRQPPGTEVRINVGRNVPVPPVLGLPLQTAVNKINAAGLNPNVVRVAIFPPDGIVFNQNPAPGARLPLGGTVTIFVRLFG
jgi:beta-lactam-binding protein with PASTA domain